MILVNILQAVAVNEFVVVKEAAFGQQPVLVKIDAGVKPGASFCGWDVEGPIFGLEIRACSVLP